MRILFSLFLIVLLVGCDLTPEQMSRWRESNENLSRVSESMSRQQESYHRQAIESENNDNLRGINDNLRGIRYGN